MGKGILTGLLEDIKEGMDDIDSNSISSSKALKTAETKGIKAFDYSLVDADTAEFLQQKEVKITQIRLMSWIAIGKELKDTFAKFAKVGYGEKTKLFDQWVQSIGISPRGARNYINAYNYMLKNFQHIEDAEKIQPSLLFAISKPSAPLELQEMVLSGDITTHKQYKELEEKLKAAEKEALEAKQHYDTISKSYDRLEKVNHKHYEKAENLEKELKEVKKQLLEAQASGDSEEVEKLNILLEDTVRELEASKDKIEELEELFNDNAEIATAVVEKVPDEIYEELEELRELNLSAEINAEIKSILKNLNKDVMGLALVLCRFKGKQISMDCIKIISEIRTNMIHLKSLSNQNLNIDLFDFIKD